MHWYDVNDETQEKFRKCRPSISICFIIRFVKMIISIYYNISDQILIASYFVVAKPFLPILPGCRTEILDVIAFEIYSIIWDY